MGCGREGGRESAASADRCERRNWIVILFSKAICKCYQKFSGHASHSPLAPQPSTRKREAAPFLSSFARFSSLFRAESSRRTDATRSRDRLHLNFGFFDAPREDVRDERIRHGKLLSENSRRRRCELEGVYWPLSLQTRCCFCTIRARPRACKYASAKRYKSHLFLSAQEFIRLLTLH